MCVRVSGYLQRLDINDIISVKHYHTTTTEIYVYMYIICMYIYVIYENNFSYPENGTFYPLSHSLSSSVKRDI